MKKNKELKELIKVFDEDMDLVLFFMKWVEKGRNATQAYIELHPQVNRISAQVMGSKLLSKIPRDIIMKTYGLGFHKYMKQLKSGLEATKWNDFTGEREPDHKTRLGYHDKQGKLLGIEGDTPMILQQFNIDWPSWAK